MSNTTTTDLLLHPVRMRIVNALSRGQPLTTAGLVERIGEFGQATVYRHVARLLRAGVIEVDSEERVRGAVERRYRLRPERTRISAEDAAAMSVADHRRAFTAAVASLIAEFNSYLDQEGADPLRDGVGYRQFVLWLDRSEVEQLAREIGQRFLAQASNTARPGRTLYRLSPIAFPIDASTHRRKDR